ncbi:hypothetical protein BH10PSE19_BH10PSE19_23120 [soil metagenome]
MSTIAMDKIFTTMNNPILYNGKSFLIVKFGLFSAIASFVTTSLFLTYLASKGIVFGPEIIFWYTVALLLSVFFSKLLHPLVVGKEFFVDPKKYLRQTAFYNQGGQIGIIVGMLLLSYAEKISPLLLLDAICYGGCLALVIGRIGCYNYGCCYGRPTNSWFSIRYTHQEAKILRVNPQLYNVKIIPTQLIHAGFDFVLFVGLTLVYFAQPQDGVLCLIFGVCYNIFRLTTQKFRGNEIDQHSKREEKIFVALSRALIFISLLLPLLIYFYYEHLSTTPTIVPLSFTLYFKTIFLNLSYLVTSILGALIYFFAHGYHKTLGKHI